MTAQLLSDVLGFATTISVTLITQYFLYRSNILTNERHAVEVKSALASHQVAVAANFDKVEESIAENTKISKEAFHEANNANMKIAAALKITKHASDQADRIEANTKERKHT